MGYLSNENNIIPILNLSSKSVENCIFQSLPKPERKDQLQKLLNGTEVESKYCFGFYLPKSF